MGGCLNGRPCKICILVTEILSTNFYFTTALYQVLTQNWAHSRASHISFLHRLIPRNSYLYRLPLSELLSISPWYKCVFLKVCSWCTQWFFSPDLEWFTLTNTVLAILCACLLCTTTLSSGQFYSTIFILKRIKCPQAVLSYSQWQIT